LPFICAFYYNRLMSTIINSIDQAIANRIKIERQNRDWSLDRLATASGVSKAMISKIERCEASATAALLGKLSGALGLTLSALLSSVEGKGSNLNLRKDQQQWQDPETGFRRTALSPINANKLQLVLGELPPSARIGYPATSYTFFQQQIWIIAGKLSFREGEIVHELGQGDCLQLGEPADCEFYNSSPRTICRYLIALVKQ
jgi:transcriptional regulator with XRE-family HTH domain